MDFCKYLESAFGYSNRGKYELQTTIHDFWMNLGKFGHFTKFLWIVDFNLLNLILQTVNTYRYYLKQKIREFGGIRDEESRTIKLKDKHIEEAKDKKCWGQTGVLNV